jgi:hypothetical protein
MSLAAPVIGAVGAGVSLFTSIQQGRATGAALEAESGAQRNASAYRIQVARNQAAIARRNKREAEFDAQAATEDIGEVARAGQEQAQRQDIDARQEIGALIADQSATGLSGGSQRAAANTLRFLAGLDRKNIARNTQRAVVEMRDEARRFQQEAINFENDARAAEASAYAEHQSGIYAQQEIRARRRSNRWRTFGGATSSLLDGAGAVADYVSSQQKG